MISQQRFDGVTAEELWAKVGEALAPHGFDPRFRTPLQLGPPDCTRMEAFAVFGLVSYLVGIRAIPYLIGFLNNVFVPKAVDAGPLVGTPEAVALDLALLLLFAAAHSLMARPAFKARLHRLLPAELERSFYTLVSALLLLLLFWQWRPLPEPLWTVEAELGRHLLWGLASAGWVLALIAFHTLGHSRLFGISQAWRYLRGREQPENGLVRKGVYRFLRHPVHLGFLVGCWATPEMSRGRLLFVGVMTLYIAMGLRYEERDLKRRHGEEYEEYRRRVRAFVPGSTPRLPKP